jgi:hypothetical protein
LPKDKPLLGAYIPLLEAYIAEDWSPRTGRRGVPESKAELSREQSGEAQAPAAATIAAKLSDFNEAPPTNAPSMSA